MNHDSRVLELQENPPHPLDDALHVWTSAPGPGEQAQAPSQRDL